MRVLQIGPEFLFFNNSEIAIVIFVAGWRMFGINSEEEGRGGGRGKGQM